MKAPEPMTASSEEKSDNNPYHKTAQYYERKLNLPIIRSIRRGESTRIYASFNELIRSDDTVLEIGCGTGYYTRDLIKRAKRVIALDDSESMLNIIRNRLSAEEVARMAFVRSEATRFTPEEPIDVVVHIGVLDYVPDWQAFLDHSLTHARRAVIFTCPSNGLCGQMFHLLSKWEGVDIQRYTRRQLEDFLQEKYPDWRCEIHRVGINSGWTGGSTWVCTLKRG